MNAYILYTDGAYSSTRDQMGIGIIFLKDDIPIIEYSRMYSGGSNNKAELAAIIVALRMIKHPIESLTIVTDSEYCIGCAILGWKREKNVKLWQEFDKQYKRVKELCPNISFVHTKGHQKDNSIYTKWNNRVDELAVMGSHKISKI